MKGYFDFNCKDKGKDYDAVRRRGKTAAPYFGFVKGGVLPKTTLFYRNPSDKFSADDHQFFSSSKLSAEEGEQAESSAGEISQQCTPKRLFETPTKTTPKRLFETPKKNEAIKKFNNDTPAAKETPKRNGVVPAAQ